MRRTNYQKNKTTTIRTKVLEVSVPTRRNTSTYEFNSEILYVSLYLPPYKCARLRYMSSQRVGTVITTELGLLRNTTSRQDTRTRNILLSSLWAKGMTLNIVDLFLEVCNELQGVSRFSGGQLFVYKLIRSSPYVIYRHSYLFKVNVCLLYLLRVFM